MNKSTSPKIDFLTEVDFGSILTNPILDIAARVWDEDRYDAFKICYRSMRRIDDLVDDRKISGSQISPQEASVISRMMFDWLHSIQRRENDDSYQREFLGTLQTFAIPLWPWERLCNAMLYDLTHNGFSSFAQFLRYTEGAAIAPAAVFVHLCGINQVGERYTGPQFDLRKAARPLAIFSYVVHIIRDFEKDQLRGLNYFSDELLRKHGLSIENLREVAESKIPTDAFRGLMRDYQRIGLYYQALARRTLDGLMPMLEPRYQLSLDLIYSLYLQVFEKLNPRDGQFNGDSLQPSSSEISAQIESTIRQFE
ncbi:MAG: squalene/phytoene synthase family protein [candidate division Zixibacteria bacterium]|nr:squalene/phytoene synthase family protein [candidate division Zixibacteria bacterium]